MRKGNMLRSALAIGMAFSLTAAPLCHAESAGEAEPSNQAQVESEVLESIEGMDQPELLGALGEFDETEFAQDLGDSLDGMSLSAQEGYFNIAFGDGLYQLYGQSGIDMSWLESGYVYYKVVPAENALDCELSVMLNETPICNAQVSVDLAEGAVCCSIPQFFDQPIVIHVKALSDQLMNGGSGSAEAAGDPMTQMIVNLAAEFVKQMTEVIRSIPAETWQQEVLSYIMPVMSRMTQESGQDVITIGDASVDVTTQTFAISSENMGAAIKDYLTALSNDVIVEKVLQSDAVTNVLSVVSMLTGGKVAADGNALLNQYRSVLQNAAQSDFSGLPGFSLTVQTGTDSTAFGFVSTLQAGSDSMDLLTFKSIGDGTENCFEITPGAMLLSLYGMDPSMAIDVLGEGSTEGGKLNEAVTVTLNGEDVAYFTIIDFDLEAVQRGELLGSFHVEAAGMTLDVVYGMEEDGTHTLDYLVNEELFYHLDYWMGQADSDQIEAIDVKNAVAGDSIEGIMKWIGTFRMQDVMDVLAEAGVPLGIGTAAAPAA